VGIKEESTQFLEKKLISSAKFKVDLHFKFTHLKTNNQSNQMVRSQMSGVLNLERGDHSQRQ